MLNDLKSSNSSFDAGWKNGLNAFVNDFFLLPAALTSICTTVSAVNASSESMVATAGGSGCCGIDI